MYITNSQEKRHILTKLNFTGEAIKGLNISATENFSNQNLHVEVKNVHKTIKTLKMKSLDEVSKVE